MRHFYHTINIKIFSFLFFILLLLGIFFNYQENSKLANDFLTTKLKELEFITGFCASQCDTLIDTTFSLVSTAANDPEILAAFINHELQIPQSVDDLSKISIYNSTANCLAIYLLDNKGNCFLSTDSTFIGKNYSFRPYFKNAIEGNPFLFMAIGVTSKQLGYYFSYPVKSYGKIQGIIVFKLKPEVVSSIFTILENANYNFMLVDKYGIVLMSNNRTQLYHSLHDLSKPVLEEITNSQMFPFHDIRSLNLDAVYNVIQEKKSFIHNSGDTVLYSSAVVKYPQWRLILSMPQSSMHSTYQAIFNNRNLYLGITIFCILIVSYFVARITKLQKNLKEYNKTLEEVIEMRTRELEISNERLLKTQKLDQIRILASGMAHDFNNIITTIWGYITFIKGKIQSDNPIYKHICIVEKSVEKAASMSREIMDFGGKQNYVFQEKDIVSIMRDICEKFEDLLPETIIMNCGANLKHAVTSVDKLKLNRVFLNILNNAKEAMEDSGGSISVSIYKSENRVNPFSEENREQNYYSVKITDTGPGIPDHVKEKIFEPFFTTKPSGKGTGLGLSMCHEIIRGHGGWIEFFSTVGETTFIVHLPINQNT